MKLVSRDTCRAQPRDVLEDFPEALRKRIRNLRFLEETRSGWHRRGGFPPYVSGCPDNVAVGAVAAMAAATSSQTDTGRPSTQTQHRGTIAEIALARYGKQLVA